MSLRSSFSSLRRIVLCAAIFAHILHSAEPRIRNITEFDLSAAVIRLNLNVSKERLDEILSCTQPTVDPRRYLDCEKTVNEILLRNQWRSYGESCNATEEDNKDLLSPRPERVFESDYDIVDGYESYTEWQDRLIDSGKVFCNPFEHLTCAAGGTCECAEVLSSRSGPSGSHSQCVANVHAYCSTPGYQEYYSDNPSYFDPFSKSYTTIKEPPCLQADGSVEICTTGLRFFHAPVCLDTGNKVIKTLDQNLFDRFQETLEVNPVLNHGKPCDFLIYNNLALSPNTEWTNVTKRKDVIQRKLGTSSAAALLECEGERFLVCGTPGLCECFPPSFWNSTAKACVFNTSDEYCEYGLQIRKETSKFSPYHRSGLVRGYYFWVDDFMCDKKKGRKCRHDVRLHPTPFCGCRENYRIGKNCTELTKFLYFFSSANMLPSDSHARGENLRVFLDFNEKAVAFEKLFTLNSGDKCLNGFANARELEQVEFEAHNLTRYIRKLNFPGTRLTREEMKQLTKSIAEFTNKFEAKYNNTNASFCKADFRDNKFGYFVTGVRYDGKRSPLMKCQSVPGQRERTCVIPTLASYLDIFIERLNNTHTLGLDEPCPRDLKDKVLEEECPLQSRIYKRDAIERFSDMIANVPPQERFCSKEAGLICKFENKEDVKGKCVSGSSKLRDSGLFVVLVVLQLLN